MMMTGEKALFAVSSLKENLSGTDGFDIDVKYQFQPKADAHKCQVFRVAKYSGDDDWRKGPFRSIVAEGKSVGNGWLLTLMSKAEGSGCAQMPSIQSCFRRR